MITRLLSISEPPILKRYITANCFWKMFARVGHVVSRPFIKNLINVNKTAFTFDPSIEPSTNTHNDEKFLADYIPKTNDWEGRPALTTIRKESKLYSASTCAEFHELLVWLLERFKDLLKSLVDVDDKISDDPRAAELVHFNKLVKDTLWVAHGLHLLSKTAALEIHLQTIESHLMRQLANKCQANPGNDSCNPVAAQPASKADRSYEDDHDPELDSLAKDILQVAQSPVVSSFTASIASSAKPGAVVPLWRTYKKWITLLSNYYDAVDTLQNFVDMHRRSRRNMKLSCRVLAAPDSDRTVPHWTSLFDNVMPLEDDSQFSRHNNDIFVELWAVEALQLVTLTEIKGHVESAVCHCQNKNAEKTAVALQKLAAACQVPDFTKVTKKSGRGIPFLWKASIERLPEQFSVGAKELNDVLSDLQLLQDRINFYVSFNKMNIKGVGGNIFGGTTHCEANLCSVLQYVKPDVRGVTPENIVKELEVCHI